MALNLADRLAVRAVIVPRCTAAVANYALYILGNQAATAPQKAWATGAIQSPASVGDRVSYHVLNQPDFIADGSGISDATLGGAVEAAINSYFIES
jgi:hypothetical protein